VRLHRMFLQAEDVILEAVAGFIAGKKECRTVIRDFIRRTVHESGIPPAPPVR